MNTKETKKSITQHGLDNWFLYRHIRADKNEPFYIGIGKDLGRPASSKYRNKIWKSIVAKTNYTIEILLENLSQEDVIRKEIEFIKLYGRKDIGTGCLANMTSGGEGCNGMIYTEERNNKISKSLTGRKKTKEAIHNNILGNNKRMPITIDGIEYLSLRQAGLALGMHKATIKKLYLN